MPLSAAAAPDVTISRRHGPKVSLEAGGATLDIVLEPDAFTLPTTHTEGQRTVRSTCSFCTGGQGNDGN